ncbi:hypothetical protein SAMN05878482_10438 [Peribacillus simplex]|uniref:Uncharacterized protein n=1 Tax=Peribacillus simplex TaxID=1478 RepID=A0A9X8R9W2_9BACI|nr:hypothetical protein SAMN05878482_10438 [Peribacillus simplex]
MRDSCGSSGTGETPQAFTPRRLTARPAESEHLEGKSTTPLYLENSNKVSENSQKKGSIPRFSLINDFVKQRKILPKGFWRAICHEQK